MPDDDSMLGQNLIDVRNEERINRQRPEIEAVPTEIILPLTGEIINLDEPQQVAHALNDVRELKRQLDDVRRILETVLVDEAQRQGTKTLHLAGTEATITGGQRLAWDIERLQELQELGLPQERYDRLVKTVVEYKVDAAVAKQLEGSGNEDYAAVIQAARSYEPTAWRVSVTVK